MIVIVPEVFKKHGQGRKDKVNQKEFYNRAFFFYLDVLEIGQQQNERVDIDEERHPGDQFKIQDDGFSLF